MTTAAVTPFPRPARPLYASDPLDVRIDAMFQHRLAHFAACGALHETEDTLSVEQRTALGWPLDQICRQLASLSSELHRQLPEPSDEPVLDGDCYMVWAIEHAERGHGPWKYGPYTTPQYSPRVPYSTRPLHEQVAKILFDFHVGPRRATSVRPRDPRGHDWSCDTMPDKTACTSLADLQRWFYGAVPALERAGYEIACYRAEAEHCTTDGPGLLAFDRTHATLVSRCDMHGRELAT